LKSLRGPADAQGIADRLRGLGAIHFRRRTEQSVSKTQSSHEEETSEIKNQTNILTFFLFDSNMQGGQGLKYAVPS
jgi:hypothetical protein